MKNVLFIVLAVIVIGAINMPYVAAANSDVTITVSASSDSGQDGDGNSGNNSGGNNSGNNNSGGNNSGSDNGGNNGANSNHPNKPDSSAGGTDSNGNDYYLRPGITVSPSAKSYGYMLGRPNWVFAPTSPLTRAEFATIIDRIFAFKDESITKRFEDTIGHWAEDSICRLASNGVVVGVSSKEFNPNGFLKRDEVLLMLSRILYTEEYSTTSTEVDLTEHYASKTMAKMLNSGIYDKIPDNYDITSNITRGEMVHIINNIIYSRNYNVSLIETQLKNQGVFKDLLSNSEYVYYKDCVKSLNRKSLNIF